MMTKISYSGYRFPPEIIQHAIWLYVRFTLSFRDGAPSHRKPRCHAQPANPRRWVNHIGPKIAADLRKRRPKPHTTFGRIVEKMASSARSYKERAQSVPLNRL
jgi:putative transposase